MKKILIGSPIHQKPQILEIFLNSLKRLNNIDMEIHYLFIDDNIDKKSTELLKRFAYEPKNIKIINGDKEDSYFTNEQTHYWNDTLVWKVANFKNKIIQEACEGDYDFLFLLDSDLILHPYTLQQLIQSEKDIVSNIFWTKWQPDLPELPQVWMFDEYEQYYKKSGENLTDEEKTKRHIDFINMLRVPGVYEVGGLGACTLISKKAIKAGVNFNEIKNISFWGEDRHFCIRAQALGLSLFVDTNYPAFHIYRYSDLSNANNYFKETDLFLPLDDKEQIINTVIKGIENLGTDSSKDLEWREFFTEEFIYSIEKQKENEENDEAIVKANVYDVKITKVDKVKNTAHVKFLLVNVGTLNYEEIKEKFLCNINLIKKNGIWLISELIIEEDVTDYSFHRKIEKNPRKHISLIYTNFSGSNSIALYKNIPDIIKNEYNIELLKQTNEEDFYTKIINSDMVITTEGNFILDKKYYYPDQKVIELWHGFPLKSMGFKDKTDLNINRIGKTWSNVDFIASYSSLFSEKMNECIRTDKDKYYITGSPRNDFLLRKTDKKNLSEVLNKDLQGKKCLFYLPTFRYSFMKGLNEGERTWENVFDLDDFNNEEFKDFLRINKLELIVKLHPAEEVLLLNDIKKFDYINFITDRVLEENNLDLYEILGGGDLLITDYSSVYFDFLLLDKPIIFTPTDLAVYKQKRGLIFEYEKVTPGPKVLSQKDLQMEIINSLQKREYYKIERDRLKELIHFYQDDKSSSRIWNLITT
ncbi:CDP-glycerol glycerophosphotransferase family protein [Bacillus sp. 22-7]|uniref:CDP-glycerol glycerophosphotransferase family protein n=1 Tax=Bacillus sp. 22-7 TaxID=2709707 RepID=UPI0013D7C977|nr:CDP-glycerol glycerophosphotransferase family protein [Bacillus sp. 22-7]